MIYLFNQVTPVASLAAAITAKNAVRHLPGRAQQTITVHIVTPKHFMDVTLATCDAAESSHHHSSSAVP